jgi:hypothetical protein
MDEDDEFLVLNEQLPEDSTIGMAAEFLTINAQLKCKESGTVSMLKLITLLMPKFPSNNG